MQATVATAPTAASVSNAMPQPSARSQSLWYLESRSERQPLGAALGVVILVGPGEKAGRHGDGPSITCFQAGFCHLGAFYHETDTCYPNTLQTEAEWWLQARGQPECLKKTNKQKKNNFFLENLQR